MKRGFREIDRPAVKAAWALLTLGIAAGIAILTLLPPADMPRDPIGSDKLAHALAFMLLVFPTAALWPRISALVAVAAVAYGGAIELVQPLTGRDAELADLVADGIGIGLAIVLGIAVRRAFGRRRAARTR